MADFVEFETITSLDSLFAFSGDLLDSENSLFLTAGGT